MASLHILLANNTLRLLAGTETWTFTLAVQLQKLGHKVECFSPRVGEIAEQLAKTGIRCRSHFGYGSRLLARFLAPRYDLIIANHYHIVRGLRRIFPRVPIISTIHGIIHLRRNERGKQEISPEHPALDARVNQFVSVSEEVQQLLTQNYNIDSVIVRNSLDVDRFAPDSAVSPKPRRILFNSNYTNGSSPEVEVMREVAKGLGAELVLVGVNHTMLSDVRQCIQESDIVAGLGRSVLEGAAMGRLALVHGHWGTGGILCPQNSATLRRCNFSGRNAKGEMLSPSDIISLVRQYYTPAHLNWEMSYVRQEHNVVHAAGRYLELARKVLATSPLAHRRSALDPAHVESTVRDFKSEIPS